jgi:hypothetical protein
MTGKRYKIAAHINKDLTPHSDHVVFCSCYHFTGGEDQLILQTVLRFPWWQTSSSTQCYWIWMFLFLVIIIQMGHGIHDNINDYLPTTEQSSAPFYGKSEIWQIPSHSYISPLFKQWKLRHTFDLLKKAYSECYMSSEHLAMDEVTVLLKGGIIFIHYIPKAHICKWIQ